MRSLAVRRSLVLRWRQGGQLPGGAQGGEDGIGDAWTWTAICADTKLVPSFLVGSLTLDCATDFVADLARRLPRRVQLTTDGLRLYLRAVDDAFGGDVDYAMLVKL